MRTPEYRAMQLYVKSLEKSALKTAPLEAEKCTKIDDRTEPSFAESTAAKTASRSSERSEIAGRIADSTEQPTRTRKHDDFGPFMHTSEQVQPLPLIGPTTTDEAQPHLGGDGPIALDFETYGRTRLDEDAALSPEKGEIGVVSLKTEIGNPTLINHRLTPIDVGQFRRVIGDRELIAHNAHFESKWLKAKFGLQPARLFCTLTAARLLSNGTKQSNKLEAVLEREFGVRIPKALGQSDWGGMFLTEEQLQYAANDVRYLHALKARQIEQLRAADLERVFELECALIPVVIKMEHAGYAVDNARLTEIRDDARKAANEHKAELGKQLGRGVNVDSPEQLKDALIGAGLYIENTSEENLCAIEHPLAEEVLAYREVEMQRRQAQVLLEAVRTDGRIHASFNALGAQSGRFASTNPNLQQVKRGEMRSAFVAAPGNSLIVADYSQIELRAAAYLSGDEAMLEAFRNGKDLHIQTGAILLDKSPEAVTKDDRQIAKSANFGLIYGQQALGLKVYARTKYGVTLTTERATAIRRKFFSHYKGLAAWHRKAHASSPNVKEGRTQLGRRRLPAPGASDWDRFQLLVNFRVQGSCADGLKLAMLRLFAKLPASAQLIATLHDELIVECPETAACEVKALTVLVMTEEMTKVFPGLPIVVEAKVCSHWGEK
jgi:DNA polymerase-1